MRKKALLKAMGGFTRLRAASLDDILAVRAVPEEVAREVFAVLAQYNSVRNNDISEGIGVSSDEPSDAASATA